MAHRDHRRFDLRQAPERDAVLPFVQVEARPAGIEAAASSPPRRRPLERRAARNGRQDGPACARGCGAREAARPRRPHSRSGRRGTARASGVRAPARFETCTWSSGPPGRRADRLGGAFAGDDVGLPLVGVDERAAELSEPRQAAEMRTMRMGHGDVLEVSRRAPDPPKCSRAPAERPYRRGCRPGSARRRGRTDTRERVRPSLPDAVDAGSDAHPVAVYARAEPGVASRLACSSRR